MKKTISLIAVIASCWLMSSCLNKAPQRIVSETPIKSEVLGLKLCGKSSENAVEKAVTKALDKIVITNSTKSGEGTTIRVYPLTLDISYGGLSWNYIDVLLNEKKEIVIITIAASYENVERAKDQYNAAIQVFSQKYGKENVSNDRATSFWTDNVNTVGVMYREASAINGSDRSFCEIYYLNIELMEAFEKANTPDV